MRIYFIGPNKDAPAPYPQSWWDTAVADITRSCPAGCGGVAPAFCPRPVNVPFEVITTETIIPCALVKILSRALYDLVAPFLTGHVQGSCVRADDGTVIPTHVTLYALPGMGLFMDGADPQKTQYFVCPTCGDRYAQYSPKYVIRRSDFAGRRAALVSRHSALAVDEDLMRQIKSMNFKNIHISSVPVVD